MANAAQHATLGMIAGGSTYLLMCKRYDRQRDFGELLLCAGVGLLAAGLPDLIEPASTPHHRQRAHSVSAASLLVKLVISAFSDRNQAFDEFNKILLSAAIVGYLSHLAADGCTPRGLPLLN